MGSGGSSLIVLALVFGGAAHAGCAPDTVELRGPAGVQRFSVEIADSEAERSTGLMFREKMGLNEGMVFVFERPAGVCMWMKNTLLPLSVAFIDGTGKIINIEDMKPQTTESHCAKQLASFALEMNQGWFKQKNIKAGAKIEGLPLARQ